MELREMCVLERSHSILDQKAFLLILLVSLLYLLISLKSLELPSTHRNWQMSVNGGFFLTIREITIIKYWEHLQICQMRQISMTLCRCSLAKFNRGATTYREFRKKCDPIQIRECLLERSQRK